MKENNIKAIIAIAFLTLLRLFRRFMFDASSSFFWSCFVLFCFMWRRIDSSLTCSTLIETKYLQGTYNSIFFLSSLSPMKIVTGHFTYQHRHQLNWSGAFKIQNSWHEDSNDLKYVLISLTSSAMCRKKSIPTIKEILMSFYKFKRESLLTTP